MKNFTKIAICALLISGCASHGQTRGAEEAETNQKILRENESRLHSLENSVSALNNQVAQLNNRVYEVRTRGGQKTSMTVVPIIPSQVKEPQGKVVQPTPVAATPAPVSPPVPATRSKAPVGKKINPAEKPSPLVSPAPAPAPKPQPATPAPSVAGSSGSVGQPEYTAGASGQLSSSHEQELGLPPAEVLVPTGNSSGNAMMAPVNSETVVPESTNPTPVPVPLIPTSDLSLPPEHPDIAAVPQAAPAQAAKPATQTQPTTRTAAPAQGEEAAYKEALTAARAGRTAEGIRLFRDFLQKYPNGRYAANADFWIGECLYSQGKYQDALNQYQVVNNTFPRHHKNADALFKAGMTLQKMGNNAGAQEKFRQVIQSFPNSDAAKRARAMGAGR